MNMMNNTLLKMIKIALSLALLGYLFTKIDLQELFNLLINMDIYYLSAAVFLDLVMFLINSYRWQILLDAISLKMPLFELLSSLFVGSFFNTFLPTSIGGDVYRAIGFAKYTENKIDAASSIIMDRLSGLIGLFLINFFFLIFAYPIIKNYKVVIFAEFALLGIFAGIGILASGSGMKLILRFKPLRFILIKLSAADLVKKVYLSFHVYSQRKDLVARSVFYSVISKILWVVEAYIIALALDIHISIYLFFLFIPIIELIRTVPISFNGIGLREGAFVFFLGPYSSSAQALLLGMIFYALLYINSIIGGLLYLKQSFD